jgi:DNA (cytosine-5)-methyltransferase 1
MPRLLDLYCGAGGAAMGYHRAGFDVVGVDIAPQPRYPFEFHKAGALEFLKCLREADDIGDALGALNATGGLYLSDFAAIHASPPCQAFTIANNIHGRTDHPDLIRSTRRALMDAALPYVIENVPGAPLHFPILVCGLALGLKVRRHRLFESNVFLWGTGCPGKEKAADYLIVFGGAVEMRGKQIGRTAKNGPMMRRKRLGAEKGRAAMGIDWPMDKGELSQTIPPAYTEFIGRQLLEALEN